jgi:hypothetical protein
MIRTVVALLSLVAAAAVTTPGKLAVWSARTNGRRRTTYGPAVKDASSYDSRTYDVENVQGRIEGLTKHAEVVVFIQHEQNEFPEAVLDSIRTSNALDVFPHVYHSASGVLPLGKAVLDTPTFKLAKTDLSSLDDESVYTDAKSDAFVVTLKGTAADRKVLKKLAEIGGRKNVVFVSVVEPPGVAPRVKARYSRLLEDENDGVITEDQLYLPEGTEFTIFYAGEYLYLTPDLFTGLMTMIFIFFVGIIGFTCLGDIQGNVCYPTKLPPLGREG